MAYERIPLYGKYSNLIGPHRAGLYPLPDEVVAAYEATVRLGEARRRPLPLALPPAHQALHDRLAEAAVAGDELPDGREELARAEAVDRAGILRAEAVDRTSMMLEWEFVELVQGQADEIVRDYLRPAFDAVLDEVRKAGAALGGHPLDSDALIDAEGPVRAAWGSLAGLAERYQALRAARWNLVYSTDNAESEVVFAELHNAVDVWPGIKKRGVPPWPTEDARKFLVWLVMATDPAPEPWLPTAAEVVDRYNTYFAEGIAAMRRGRDAAAKVAAWGGG